MPKLVVRRLLQPVLPEPNLRLLCHEDDFDGLLADLALHRLDVVLADRAAPAHPNLKVYSHALGSSALSWYAPAPLLAQARRGFPQSLARGAGAAAHAACRGAPPHRPVVRAPGPAPARGRANSRTARCWSPSAPAGMGVFAAPDLVHDKLSARYEVKRIGACDGVEEHFFAIGTERKIQHPLVQRLLPPRA